MIWKDVKGYEGLYKASTNGDIKSLRKYAGSCFRKERILSNNRLTKDGYCRVALIKNGKTKEYRTHRLIAETFIPNPQNKETVNHINGIKTDNRVENLEWCTREENMKHAYDNNLKLAMKGVVNAQAKLTEEDVKYIKEHYVRYSKEFGTVALAKKFNVTHRVINLVVRNISYKNVK